MNSIRFGIPTGHLRIPAVESYRRLCPALEDIDEQKRITTTPINSNTTGWFYFLNPHDMIAATSMGDIDFAITGSDILEEHEAELRQDSVDSHVLPSPVSWHVVLLGNLDAELGYIITEYPTITNRHFPHAQLRSIRGSAEAWAHLQNTPVVTALQSGDTAKKNGLQVLQILEAGHLMLLVSKKNQDRDIIPRITTQLCAPLQ